MSDSNLTPAPAERIADLLHAKQRGRGKWIANCPAHSDKTPSLSIKEGRDGRCLLWCFAGCRLSEILEKTNLELRDLFPSSPSSPEQMRAAVAERDRRERAKRERAQAERLIASKIRKLTMLHDEVGEKLAYLPDQHPDSARLTMLYHNVLARLRAAEAAVEQ
jgi:phage/plasmid primase-like uncharacterized protein